MEAKIRSYFDDLIKDAESAFEHVELERDISVRRALLKLNASCGTFEIRVTEVIDEKGRNYAYYVLKEGAVVMGFDNAPDITALKLKYGEHFRDHLSERIPHVHGKAKKSIQLTTDLSFRAFLEQVSLLERGEP